MNRILLFLIASGVLTMNGLYGQTLTGEQVKFVKDQAVTISQDENLDNADWKSVEPVLKNKKIVMLGEANHGTREIFQLRNSLIKYLHEKMDFNVILFESGTGELLFIDMNKKKLQPEQMTYGFFGIWRTKEFRDLMKYVTDQNMSIAGFDVQRPGSLFRNFFKQVSDKISVDTNQLISLEKRFGAVENQINSRTGLDSLTEKTNLLISNYQETYNQIAANNASSAEQVSVSLLLKSLSNRMHYLTYMLNFAKDQDWNKHWIARDSAMAENVKWLSDNIFKDKKLILIGHNFHLSKSNENEKVTGEYLAKKYPGETYSMGIFPGEGVYANNSGREAKTFPPDTASLDIQHIIKSTDGFAAYLDIPRQKAKGGEWLHENIVVNNTYINSKWSNKMILAKSFDGILLIKKSSMPEKL
jgi:erythromycin esterase